LFSFFLWVKKAQKNIKGRKRNQKGGRGGGGGGGVDI